MTLQVTNIDEYHALIKGNDRAFYQDLIKDISWFISRYKATKNYQFLEIANTLNRKKKEIEQKYTGDNSTDGSKSMIR